MKILHLISSSSLFGAERVVIELSKSLKNTYDCHPIVGIIKNAYNPHIEVAEEAKANHIDSVIFPCRGQFDLKLISLIRKYIKNNKIDIIHCHGYKSNFYGLLSAKNKLPLVTTNHNWLTHHWRLKIYCFLDGLWIRYFDRIVAVSDDIKKDMLRYRIPEKKIIVIDNGIDIERFSSEISTENIKEEFGINGNIKVIGTIGSLKIEKGHIYLLKGAKEIIKKYKDIKFFIIGDGPLRKQLEDEAKNLGIEKNVIFTGLRNDVPELLSIMDVFVLPSIKEGLPMVLLEAMAAKKPVVATRVGAVPKVIENDENGILIGPKDVSGLEKAIITLINNKEKAHDLAFKGYTKVKKYFSSENMCRRYLNLYQELIFKRLL